MHKEYFVVRRSDAGWRVEGVGTSIGPYVSKEAAKDAAIELAKADFSKFIHARVFIEDSLMSGMRLIYDSASNQS